MHLIKIKTFTDCKYSLFMNRIKDFFSILWKTKSNFSLIPKIRDIFESVKSTTQYMRSLGWTLNKKSEERKAELVLHCVYLFKKHFMYFFNFQTQLQMTDQHDN